MTLLHSEIFIVLQYLNRKNFMLFINATKNIGFQVQSWNWIALTLHSSNPSFNSESHYNQIALSSTYSTTKCYTNFKSTTFIKISVWREVNKKNRKTVFMFIIWSYLRV